MYFETVDCATVKPSREIPIEADEERPIKYVWPDPPRQLAAQYVELMAENNHLRFKPPARHNTIA
jgi:hypothetical protein